MVSLLDFTLVALAVIISLTDSFPLPEPVALVVGHYGNPVMFMRDKRAPSSVYPQRALMFTGYYRPIRRTSNGDQATAVFAQGNSIKAGTYFGGTYQPSYLRPGPEPASEPEILNDEAEATPQLEENLNTNYQGHRNQVPGQANQEDKFQDQGNQDRDKESQGQGEESQDRGQNQGNRGQLHGQDQGHRNQGQGSQVQIFDQPQSVPKEDSYPVTITSLDESTSSGTETAVVPPKKTGIKKGKTTPRPVEEEEEYEEYEDDEEFIGDIAPFVPMKGKRRQQYPNRNIFFPMMFGYPGGSSRSGSPGFPGSVTAIANSYSTGKGGVANSVATAYGGSPQKKARRPSTAEN